MKKPVKSELNRQILDEASEWFVEFRVGDADAEARVCFDEWLRRSPEHIRAYWEIAKTYVELPPASSFNPHKINELIAYVRSDSSANVVSLDLPPRATASRPTNAMRVEDEGPRGGDLRWRRFLATAAVTCALALAGTLWWQTERYPLYSTDTGERRSITLADGSTVDLNARSKLRVEFSKTERRVELLEGQALFEVTKDKRRAFLVQSGDALVRAVGTQFDVYRKTSGTTVTVLEGRVAVYSTARNELPAVQSNTTPEKKNTGSDAITLHPLPRASTKGSSSHSNSSESSGSATPLDSLISNSGLTDPSNVGAIVLSAGEQVTVTHGAVGMLVPKQADIDVATAWTQRKLIFQGSRLADVVEEINRYNNQQLVIDDPKLRDLKISGVYSSTDPSSLLRFLQDQGLRLTTIDSEVRIDAR